MAREFIITMTAANRMGILSAVTRAMSDLGADLFEASQTVVRGYFTMIFSARFPETLSRDIIAEHLRDVGRPFDIDVTIKNGPDEKPGEELTAHAVHNIRVGGTNRPGLLRTLSTTMAKSEVDIMGMRAVQSVDGGFEMNLKVRIVADREISPVLTELNVQGAEQGFTANLAK